MNAPNDGLPRTAHREEFSASLGKFHERSEHRENPTLVQVLLEDLSASSDERILEGDCYWELLEEQFNDHYPDTDSIDSVIKGGVENDYVQYSLQNQGFGVSLDCDDSEEMVRKLLHLTFDRYVSAHSNSRPLRVGAKNRQKTGEYLATYLLWNLHGFYRSPADNNDSYPEKLAASIGVGMDLLHQTWKRLRQKLELSIPLMSPDIILEPDEIQVLQEAYLTELLDVSDDECVSVDRSRDILRKLLMESVGANYTESIYAEQVLELLRDGGSVDDVLLKARGARSFKSPEDKEKIQELASAGNLFARLLMEPRIGRVEEITEVYAEELGINGSSIYLLADEIYDAEGVEGIERITSLEVLWKEIKDSCDESPVRLLVRRIQLSISSSRKERNMSNKLLWLSRWKRDGIEIGNCEYIGTSDIRLRVYENADDLWSRLVEIGVNVELAHVQMAVAWLRYNDLSNAGAKENGFTDTELTSWFILALETFANGEYLPPVSELSCDDEELEQERFDFAHTLESVEVALHAVDYAQFVGFAKYPITNLRRAYKYRHFGAEGFVA